MTTNMCYLLHAQASGESEAEEDGISTEEASAKESLAALQPSSPVNHRATTQQVSCWALHDVHLHLHQAQKPSVCLYTGMAVTGLLCIF